MSKPKTGAQLAAEEIFSAISGRNGFDLRSLDDELQLEIEAEFRAIFEKHLPQQPLPVKVGELLPCAFCGEPAEVDRQRGFIGYDGKHGTAVAIYCSKCSCDMTLCQGDFPQYDTEQLYSMLAGQWNTRPSTAQPLPVSGETLETPAPGRVCPHCNGSLNRYEDPEAVKIIGRLERELAESKTQCGHQHQLLRSVFYAAEFYKHDNGYRLNKLMSCSDNGKEVLSELDERNKLQAELATERAATEKAEEELRNSMGTIRALQREHSEFLELYKLMPEIENQYTDRLYYHLANHLQQIPLLKARAESAELRIKAYLEATTPEAAWEVVKARELKEDLDSRDYFDAGYKAAEAKSGDVAKLRDALEAITQHLDTDDYANPSKLMKLYRQGKDALASVPANPTQVDATLDGIAEELREITLHRLCELPATSARMNQLIAALSAHARKSQPGVCNDCEGWKRRYAAVTLENRELVQTIADIGSASPLTENQRSELASYVAEYFKRGIHGVWRNLSEAIAAMLKHNFELEARNSPQPGVNERLLAAAIQARNALQLNKEAFPNTYCQLNDAISAATSAAPGENLEGKS